MSTIDYSITTFTYVFLILMAVIVGLSVFGAIAWAVYHVLTGKWKNEYRIATAQNGSKSEKKQPKRT